MLEIDLWLNSSRDYDAGVALFTKHGKGTYLKAMLAAGPTYYNKIKLTEELIKISKAGTQEQAPKPVAEPKKAHPKSLFRPDMDTLPTEVQQVYKEATHLFKENARVHSGLMEHVRLALSKPTESEANDYLASVGAGVTVNEILDRDDELSELYKKINHYEQHGSLPEIKPLELLGLTPLEMVREIRNKRSFVSKQRNNNKRAAEVEAAIKRIQLLEENLKRLT